MRGAKMTAPIVDAVIPIRARDCLKADGTPRFVLQGRTLWDITLGHALAADGLRAVIVAHDDETFATSLTNADPRLTKVRRPDRLSASGVTTVEVLRETARLRIELGLGADYYLLMEITHPLRPKALVSDLLTALATDRPDSLITCHPVHYNFWRRDADGATSRVVGEGDQVELAIFQELIGIGSLFRTETLLGDSPFGERVDIVPIDRFWATIDVRDEDGLWLAESYLQRIGTSV